MPAGINENGMLVGILLPAYCRDKSLAIYCRGRLADNCPDKVRYISTEIKSWYMAAKIDKSDSIVAGIESLPSAIRLMRRFIR
jgi:hypothetical protein